MRRVILGIFVLLGSSSWALDAHWSSFQYGGNCGDPIEVTGTLAATIFMPEMKVRLQPGSGGLEQKKQCWWKAFVSPKAGHRIKGFKVTLRGALTKSQGTSFNLPARYIARYYSPTGELLADRRNEVVFSNGVHNRLYVNHFTFLLKKKSQCGFSVDLTGFNGITGKRPAIQKDYVLTNPYVHTQSAFHVQLIPILEKCRL